MLRLREPSEDAMVEGARSRRGALYAYPEVGATAHEALPAGYNVDRHRTRLGQGRATFDAAVSVMDAGAFLDLGWTRWTRPEVITSGAICGMRTRVFPFWVSLFNRIVYTLHEEGVLGARHAFAYGTLPGHPEQGEERFLLSWDRATDEVAFEILAFSRPGRFLTRLGYPLTRRKQKRFFRDALARMRVLAERAHDATRRSDLAASPTPAVET